MNVPQSFHQRRSWYGESVGHYEGDELVVDTIGLSAKTDADNYGTPHTADLHVVERFKVSEGGSRILNRFALQSRQSRNRARPIAESDKAPVADPVSGRKLRPPRRQPPPSSSAAASGTSGSPTRAS
jgi:hypothetical protein